MRTIFKIAKTELRDLFYSPIAWLILIIFTFQTGMLFSGMISQVAEGQVMGYQHINLTLNFFAGWSGLFSNVQSYLYLYIPLLTMGLMSRELGSGSIKLLYSSPITNTQIILGKYLAMMIYGLVLIGVLVVYAIYAIVVIEHADVTLILSGLLGVYLLLCIYVSIGLFMSSLTSYQIVAAVGTLAILAVLTYVKGMWQSIAILRDITYWFGISGRAGAFVGGLVSTEDLLYFFVVIALFLFMTIIRMQARRQKVSWMVSSGKYAGVWILAIVLAYVSSRPVFKFYYDATQLKINTLTPNSQEIIKRATGGMTITSYVNILDRFAEIGDPENYNNDIRLFEQYTRFKPEIKMKYVFYYDTIKNDQLERIYPGMTYEEKAKKEMERKKMNPKKVLTPEQIRKQIDLITTEGNRFTRLIERESGEKTFLRIYDGQQRYPGEAEITAALKRLVMKLPTVGFLTGHGERETDRPGERNYCMFTHMPSFRSSLINQGFDYKDVTLDKEIPDDVNILVIAEMRQPMTESEKINLDKYIARGGNLMIIGEPRRQEVMNPVVEQFGVKFMDGFLIQPPKAKDPEEKKKQDNINLGPFAGYTVPALPIDLIVMKPTKEAGDLAYVFNALRRSYVIVMPSATGLEYTEDKGFKVTPMFVSDSTCWNELETKEIVNEEDVKYNPEVGEVQQSYTLGLALSRKMGDKEQRIIVLGDADCISDGEFGRSRSPLWVANFGIVQGGFYWLSDGEVPIDVRRPASIDNRISTTEGGAEVLDYMLMGVFPGLLLLLYLFIWIRRRGR
ncbi:Gldg family protein [Gabonibacter chumensis]|uniref:Gldg family protein n=1 Tax=Gabonibacter chumensis TaxID=2972474 RepID=UPI00257417FC|nr:Gldg family protein [Gabonibacter chumensis]MCR9011015.1 Gldg family protein [Gabonibacter chumensis]